MWDCMGQTIVIFVKDAGFGTLVNVADNGNRVAVDTPQGNYTLVFNFSATNGNRQGNRNDNQQEESIAKPRYYRRIRIGKLWKCPGFVEQQFKYHHCIAVVAPFWTQKRVVVLQSGCTWEPRCTHRLSAETGCQNWPSPQRRACASTLPPYPANSKRSTQRGGCFY